MSNVVVLDTSKNKENKITKMDRFLGNVGKVTSEDQFLSHLEIRRWDEEMQNSIQEAIRDDLTGREMLNQFVNKMFINPPPKPEKFATLVKELDSSLKNLRHINNKLEELNERSRQRQKERADLRHEDVDLSWYRDEE